MAHVNAFVVRLKLLEPVEHTPSRLMREAGGHAWSKKRPAAARGATCNELLEALLEAVHVAVADHLPRPCVTSALLRAPAPAPPALPAPLTALC